MLIMIAAVSKKLGNLEWLSSCLSAGATLNYYRGLNNYLHYFEGSLL